MHTVTFLSYAVLLLNDAQKPITKENIELLATASHVQLDEYALNQFTNHPHLKNTISKLIQAPNSVLSVNEATYTLTKSHNTIPYNISKSEIQFSHKIMQQTFGGNKNTFISPMSIFVAISMLMAGATGTTLTEIRNALTIQYTNHEQEMQAIMAVLNSDIIQIANQIYVDNKFNINHTYATTLKQFYHSEVVCKNFENPDSARRDINAWVEQITKNKIQDLLAPNAIKPNTCSILVNAIYFKCNWKNKFKKQDTLLGQFKAPTGEISLPFMIKRNKRFEHGSNGIIEWLRIPYEGDEFEAVFVRPNEDGETEKLDEFLKEYDVLSVVSRTSYKEFDLVVVPRFKVEYEAEVSSVLQDMGMNRAFSPDAEFELMGSKNGEKISVSAIFHKTFLAVDEEGTEAAAATAIMMKEECEEDESLPVVFVLDQPFIMLIVHSQSGAILFSGKIVQPGQPDEISTYGAYYPIKKQIQEKESLGGFMGELFN
jgi:serpin B